MASEDDSLTAPAVHGRKACSIMVVFTFVIDSLPDSHWKQEMCLGASMHRSYHIGMLWVSLIRYYMYGMCSKHMYRTVHIKSPWLKPSWTGKWVLEAYSDLLDMRYLPTHQYSRLCDGCPLNTLLFNPMHELQLKLGGGLFIHCVAWCILYSICIIESKVMAAYVSSMVSERTKNADYSEHVAGFK